MGPGGGGWCLLGRCTEIAQDIKVFNIIPSVLEPCYSKAGLYSSKPHFIYRRWMWPGDGGWVTVRPIYRKVSSFDETQNTPSNFAKNIMPSNIKPSILKRRYSKSGIRLVPASFCQMERIGGGWASCRLMHQIVTDFAETLILQKIS